MQKAKTEMFQIIEKGPTSLSLHILSTLTYVYISCDPLK